MRALTYAGTALLGAALLAPAALSDAVQSPWGERCHLAWCRPTPAPIRDTVSDALEDAAAAAALADGADCVRPSLAERGRIPARMIWRATAGAPVTSAPWTYPAPAGSTVILLCY